MAAFATVPELEDYLGRTLTPEEQVRAQQSLELATGVIQDFTHQHLFRVTGDTLVLYPSSWRVVLPERPANVTSVSVDGTAVTASDYHVNEDAGLLSFSSTSTVVTTNTVVPYKLEVTYDHGYATIPQTLKAVCLAVAGRAFGNPRSLRQETTGPFSVTYAEAGAGVAGGVMLTREEQWMLAGRYR